MTSGHKGKHGSTLHLISQDPASDSDIVFIHGLGGHWQNTWRNTETGFFWPEALAKQFPSSNVWSLDYEVSPSHWSGDALPLFDRAVELLDILRSKRIGVNPLCLIAHSMGGLLGKTMIRHAFESQQEYGFFLKGLVGLEFICTPHTGSNLAAIADYLSFVLKSTVAVEELKRCAPQLRSLNHFYRTNSVSVDVRTRVFFEAKSTKGIVIVPADIADPGIIGVTPIPVQRDHHGVPKPPNDQDNLCLSTNHFLEEVFQVQVDAPHKHVSAFTELSQTPPMHERDNPNFSKVVSFLMNNVEIMTILTEMTGTQKDFRNMAELLLTPSMASDIIETLSVEAVKGDSGRLGHGLVGQAGELIFLCVSSLLSQKAIEELRSFMNEKRLCSIGVGDSIMLEIAIKTALRGKPEFSLEPYHTPVGRQRIPLSRPASGREQGPMDTAKLYESKFRDFALDKYKTGTQISYDLDVVAKQLAIFFRRAGKPFYYEFGANDNPDEKAISSVLSKFDGLQAYIHDLSCMLIGKKYQERIFVALCELITVLQQD